MPRTSSTLAQLHCALLLALAAPSLVFARDADAIQDTIDAVAIEGHQHTANAIRVFSLSPNPLERMLAATLLAGPPAASLALGTGDARVIARARDELVAGALRDAGDDDVLAWWTAAMDCPAATRAVCDDAAPIERLRVIDADNLLVWLDGLPTAPTAGAGSTDVARLDVTAADVQLARAAQATRADMRYVERVRALWTSYERIEPHADLVAAWPADYEIPATASGIAFVMAVGTALAYSMPSLSAITYACSEDAMASSPARGDQCNAIARTTTHHSDSMLLRGFGTRLGKRVARTDEERAAARIASLDVAWQNEAYAQLQAEVETRGEALQDHFSRWSLAGATEVSALQASLLAEGLPLEAPADWVPASERDGAASRPRQQPSH